MITLDHYFASRKSHPEATPAMWAAADELLGRVNALLDRARRDSCYFDDVDPDTSSCVSGSRGGAGDGGFRLSDSATGHTNSAHKRARAVDVYDPDDFLDEWLTDEMLEEVCLYREAPEKTPGWTHLQDLAPASGKRTFWP